MPAQEWAFIGIVVVTILAPLSVLISARRASRQLGPIFLLSLIMTNGLALLLEFLWYSLSPLFLQPPVLVGDREANNIALFFAVLSLAMNALLFGLEAFFRKR